MKRICLLTLICLTAICVSAQSTATNIAFTVAAVGAGNEDSGAYPIGDDFRVVRPIIVTQLGMFDSGGDGIQGSAVITIQLCESSPENKGSSPLETVTFDAASPGELQGGFRYKPLARSVTLLPGHYTLAASGFDSQNPDYNGAKAGPAVSLTVNDGGGLVRFLGCHHRNDVTLQDSEAKNMGPPGRFAAGTFVFSAAPLPANPFAADYAVLTSGVESFPIEGGKTNLHFYDGVKVPYGGAVTRNFYGSLALWESYAFPVIMEPSGNRLILEAAGIYTGDPNGARCVLFAHEQFGHAAGDARMGLFENAIRWTARKSNASDIVIALTTNLDAAYFQARGYQVRTVGCGMTTNDWNSLSGADVLVADLDGAYTELFMAGAAEFVAHGGGLVATFLPWHYVRGEVKPIYGWVNNLVKPFGLAYRSSQMHPVDYEFTEVQAVPYAPTVFNAIPAAQLLYQERQGQVQLDSLQKAMALGTIAYAGDHQPDLLAALAAIYSGTTNNGVGGVSGVSNFVDTITLAGSQAATNFLGIWVATNGDLVAQDCRGSVEYDFNVSAADIYRLQIYGAQNQPQSTQTNFDLLCSLDGVNLGHYTLVAPLGVDGKVEFMSPYIGAGAHTLRIYWDNARSDTQLRLRGVHVQTGLGPDRNGNGIKDWVEGLVDSQSGMDATNPVLTSYSSPICIEGRDPYPELMNVQVSGAAVNNPQLAPSHSPNGRWYVNAPLAINGGTVLQVSYQNGAKSEVRHLRWLPVNVLQGGTVTVRKGDSLMLVALPNGGVADNKGQMQFTIDTNQFPVRLASSPMVHDFNSPGIVAVSGVYTSAQGISQVGTITVKVVEQDFKGNPDGWVGAERDWDVPLSPEASFEADLRLLIECIAPLAGGGWQTSLLVDESGPRYFLARMGTNGPVLGSGAVKGFNFWYAKDTYLRVVDTYADGSQLVEMLLVMSPVLPDVTVELDVIVGGVVFEDGTTSKQFTKDDFDANGKCLVRFIRPPTFKPSVCHSIKLMQGTKVIGQVW